MRKLALVAVVCGSFVAGCHGDPEFIIDPPVLHGVDPNPATGGDTVTLAGTMLGEGKGGKLKVDDRLVETSAWGHGEVTFVLPGDVPAGTHALTVARAGARSKALSLAVIPGVAKLGAEAGQAGDTIALTCTNLAAGTGTAALGDTTLSLAEWSAGSSSFVVPSNAGPGVHDLQVTSGGAASRPASFTVLPAIDSFSWSGATLTLVGSNFGADEGEVTFDGTGATVASWSPTRIVVDAGTGFSAGVYPVVVAAGGVESRAKSVTVVPVLAGLSASVTAGGDPLYVSGAGFGGTQPAGTTVLVGGAAAQVTSWSPYGVQVVVPDDAEPGTQQVVVRVGDTVSAALPVEITPAVASLAPPSGTGGATITVQGTNFGAQPGTVTVGATPATVTAWSATSIAFAVPPAAAVGSQTVDIVTASGLPFAGGNVTVVPGIANVAPASAPVGASITLTGSNFGASRGSSTVTVGGTAVASYPTWSNTTIVFPLPSLTTGTKAVVVTVAGQTAGTTLTVVPGVATASVASGPVGTAVALNGSNLGATQGTVTVGGIAATITGWANTSITYRVPTVAAGTHPVVVTTSGGQAVVGTPAFTVVPNITGATPSSGTVGTSVTLGGTSFGASQGSSTLTLGGANVAVSSWSDTAIVFSVPDLAPGIHDAVVTVAGQTGTRTFAVKCAVTGLTPASGSIGAGVTIAGSNFGASQGSSSVTVGGATASITTWSATAIVFTVPTVAAGPQTVAVTVGGQATTASFAVTPRITSLNPASGSPGTAVVVAGTGFGAAKGASTVTVAGVAAGTTAWGDTSLTFTVPNAPAGAQPVTVTVNGQTATASFTVAPKITSLSPASGAVGTSVTVAGASFGAAKGASTVTLGGTTVATGTWSDTAFTFTVPSLAVGTQTLTVTVAGQTATSGFAVTPGITSLSPTSGPVGGTLTVTGTNFGATKGTSTITVGGVAATVSSWTQTSIVVTVPSLTGGAKNVVVTVSGSASNASSFTVTAGITSLTPTSGVGGTAVTITGTNFGATQGASTVTLGGGAMTVTAWTDTSITATVPGTVGAGTKNVVVTVGGNASNASPFNLAPSVRAPGSGTAGAQVTLVGQNFDVTQGASTVTLDGTVVNVVSWSMTAVVVTVPAAAAAGAHSFIVTVGGQAGPAWPFVVRPVVAGLTPTSGGAGTALTITGSGFGASAGGNQVLVGGATATVTSWSDTSITATVPTLAGAAVVPVVVVVGGLTAAPQSFRYVDEWVTDRFPNLGTTTTSITVNGTGFGSVQGTATVGGVAATIAGWTTTTVQVSVPSGVARGRQSIVLRTSGGAYTNPVPFTIRNSDVWWVEDLPAKRSEHSAVFTGSEMIVWGGSNGTELATGARYNPATDTWLPVANTGAPTVRKRHTAVWTGAAMLVWGGTAGSSSVNTGASYDPFSDQWSAIATASQPAARDSHTAVWTGTEMAVWGGQTCTPTCTALATGARYSRSLNTWTAMTATGAPTARRDHTAVWTGKEMVVWGGTNGSVQQSGARYDPAGNAWVAMTTTNAPAARSAHTAVWTGAEMLVWGGSDAGGGLNSGGRYLPVSNTWASIASTGAPSARSRHTAVWTGTRMLVWGGVNAGAPLDTGGAYDPDADAWTAMTTTNAPAARQMHTAVFTGTKLVVWGGAGGPSATAPMSSGARYDVAANTWSSMAGASQPKPTSRLTGVWTGSQFVVWGGSDGSANVNTGGRYTAATDTWLPMTTFNAPSARYGHTAVWTGTYLAIWGGNQATTYHNSGGRYNPSTDTWTTITTTGAPAGRFLHTAVWADADTSMMIWGGQDATSDLNTGSRYNPSSDTWTPIPTSSFAPARWGHSAVWAGTNLIVWGGSSAGVAINTGARYYPTTGIWQTTSTTGAPAARQDHSAVWTGTYMIVWGGATAGTPINTGAYLNPSTNTWTAMSTTGAPSARTRHRAVWTGTKLLVWGGFDTANLGTGAAYTLATNTWASLSTVNPPTARSDFEGVWTGAAFAVFGGNGGNELAMYYP